MDATPLPLPQKILDRDLKVRKRPVQEDRAFIPLPLEALLEGEPLTFPLYLKVTPGPGCGVTYTLSLEQGAELCRPWREKLQELGITRVYVPETFLPQVVAYLNNHLLVRAAEEEWSPQDFVLFREHLHFSLRLALQSPQLDQTAAPAKQALQLLITALKRDAVPWKLIWDLLYQDYTLYTHSVNVAVLGVAFLTFLRLPRQDCLTLGLAGLLHDVGLTRISPDILHKPEPLTPEEWELLRKHPCLGYRLLKSNASLPLGTVRLVLEHHELADGSGYPQGLPLQKQHPLSRYLSLLEAYDGMTLYRPYRPRLSPFTALNTLRERRGRHGSAYDPQVLKKFIELLALT
ncbi:MAG: HD domain-containing protein [Syntrophobacterales bacterium]|nr:HD domain-containing protein [Syntrophobacterales bacterium]